MDRCKKCNESEWVPMGNTRYCGSCRRAYQQSQAGRDRGRAASQAWRKRNPAKVAANTAARRAKCGPASEAVKAIYEECRRISEETGVPHHVDHIHPLCEGGLHHEDNLQILTATENLKKGRRVGG